MPHQIQLLTDCMFEWWGGSRDGFGPEKSDEAQQLLSEAICQQFVDIIDQANRYCFQIDADFRYSALLGYFLHPSSQLLLPLPTQYSLLEHVNRPDNLSQRQTCNVSFTTR